eukprot:gene52543-64214_t
MAELVVAAEKEEAGVVSCSCPGKVLLAGGYLVLERPYQALTIATTARFTTSIADSDRHATAATLIRPNALVLHVDSPQFYEQYLYVFDLDARSLTEFDVDTLAVLEHHTNPFVHKCIQLTLLFVWAQAPAALQRAASELASRRAVAALRLQADNDFY